MTKQLQLNFYWTINSKKILIIDLDVHQGNGTAEIFAKNPMCLPFQHIELTTHLKKKTDLDMCL
jgi:acetoin utilization deacetylase AcuC-like enzyme